VGGKQAHHVTHWPVFMVLQLRLVSDGGESYGPLSLWKNFTFSACFYC